MRFVFYGNCQAMVLKDILCRVLGKEHEYHYICNFELIRSGRNLPIDKFANADVLIYQPIENRGIYDTNNIVQNYIPKSCKTISFHYNFFMGYFPDYFVNPKNEKTKSEQFPYGIFPYGMKKISAMAEAGEEVADIIEKSQSLTLFTKEEVMFQLEKSIATMRTRHVDVDLTDFIMENYAQVRLFHTVNHMSNVLLEQLANGVLSKLDVNRTVSLFGEDEFMGWHKCPIYPCVVNHLDLKFDTRVVRYKKCDLTLSDFVTDYVRIHTI